MAPVTFRNSKIVYYGPHTCENCGVNIVKMGTEWGGTAFTNPEGPIYPNTEWHPHVCDQVLVRQRKGMSASSRVSEDFPLANAVMLNQMGFVILGERLKSDVQGGQYLAISANQTFCDTEDGAWISALERLQNGWPTWQIDLNKYGVHSRISNDLEALPQDAPICPKCRGTGKVKHSRPHPQNISEDIIETIPCNQCSGTVSGSSGTLTIKM